MFDCIRSWNRENIKNYREIYVRVSMEVLKKRNQKGLYSTSMEVLKKRDQKDLQCSPNNDTLSREFVGKIIETYEI